MKTIFATALMLAPETAGVPASLGEDFPIEIITGGIIAMLLLCVVLVAVLKKKK